MPEACCTDDNAAAAAQNAVSQIDTIAADAADVKNLFLRQASIGIAQAAGRHIDCMWE